MEEHEHNDFEYPEQKRQTENKPWKGADEDSEGIKDEWEENIPDVGTGDTRKADLFRGEGEKTEGMADGKKTSPAGRRAETQGRRNPDLWAKLC